MLDKFNSTVKCSVNYYQTISTRVRQSTRILTVKVEAMGD